MAAVEAEDDWVVVEAAGLDGFGLETVGAVVCGAGAAFGRGDDTVFSGAAGAAGCELAWPDVLLPATVAAVCPTVAVVLDAAGETVPAGASGADLSALDVVASAADDVTAPGAPAAAIPPSARAFGVTRGPQNARTARTIVADACTTRRPALARRQTPVDVARTTPMRSKSLFAFPS